MSEEELPEPEFPNVVGGDGVFTSLVLDPSIASGALTILNSTSKTIAPGVDAVSSNTVLTNDSPSVIVVDTAPSTITLPDTNDLLIKGMKYVIINTADDGTVTVATAVGLDTIGGIGSSLTLSSQYNKIVLMYVADNLWIEL
jgi:hypothetical protein